VSPEAIVRSSAGFLEARGIAPFPADSPAIPRAVFMVEPESFRVNAECAVDNRYMDLDHPADPGRAMAQSRALAAAMREKGVDVKVFPGNPGAPDGVFPNNAFATIPGRLIIGSMRHESRRPETERDDIRDYFTGMGYAAVDLSRAGCVAELTGPLVIDRSRRIGYCGMTDRVDEAGLRAMHKAFDLRLTFAFGLAPGEYHTNVVMSILAGRACVLCPGSFAEPSVPEAIATAFPGRCLYLDRAEKDAFAVNCIALSDRDLFMSRSGFEALRPSSLETLESWGFELCTVELDEIEKAGGSLRCMVAEIF
jgi:hypothetical protein